MKLPIPKSRLAQAAWTIGALLGMVGLTGFADCVIQPGACTKDLCWRLWLHCAWISINSPAVIGLGTLLAAVLGWGAWRHQFQGTNDYRVAVETMKGAYAVKQALRYVRRPFVMSVEMAGRSRGDKESPAEASARDMAYAYYKRLNDLIEAESKLRVAHLEAIAHWGEAVASPPLEPIWLIQRDLSAAYHSYFEHEIRTAIQGGDSSRDEFYRSLHRILFATPGKDEVGDRMEAAVKAVDLWLRPYIRGR